MKQKLLLFLFALIGLLGNSVNVLAQDVPEPTAQWNFNNADDLMAPSKGSLTMIPAVIGANSVATSTLSDAGIVQTEGPAADDKAILVPATSALKVERAEGAGASTSFTFMMDMKVPDADSYDGLFQTNANNNNDGDLFIHGYKIGMNALGGYFGKILNNTWYRIVMTNTGSNVKVYLNGEKVIDKETTDLRFEIDGWGFYLLCDEDGEKVDTYVSEVAFWETPLTDEQTNALGGFEEPEAQTFEIGTAADLLAFADFVNAGNLDAKGVLTADITLTSEWDTPIGTTEATAYTGTFDGQGHKISGFNGTSSGQFGLFGCTSSATIKNFSIDGALTVIAGTGSGVVGWPANSTISNVYSTLAIAVTEGATHHVGGVVGSARGGNTISGCTFAGSMTVVAGNSDNFAGVVAYLGGDSVVYCTNYGTITFTDTNCAAGGIAGYLNNTGSCVKGCLNMGKVACDEPDAIPTFGSAIVGRLRTFDTEKLTGNCWLEGSAYGAGRNDNGDDALKAATTFTEDKLPTGEVCYALNGDQSEIGWYQTLGSDEAPVLDPTHKQVYMNGRLHCNGDVYEGAVYSNENTGVTQDDHNIVDGFCTYCGLYDENYLSPNADGYYEIATAKQLMWFEMKVNKGVLDAKAILTADIDFADVMPEGADPEETQIEWTPIGDWGATRGTGSAGFQGHFDGQGHTIKNLNATSKQNYFGLFGVISTGCLIENFTIYGNYYTTYQYAGSVAAYARDSYPTIRGIHSYVNINNSCAGGRQGGILGGVLTTVDKTIIENCAYSGTLDGNDAGGSGNYGGIVGYVNNNGATVADITNCLFDGEVVNKNSAPGGCTFGGFVGYSNGGVVTIKNSLSIGHVESAVWGQCFGAVKSTKSSLPNTFYMGEILNGSASTVTLEANETNPEELASGKVAWALNEESFLDPVWKQTLGQENYPTILTGSAIVYQNTSGDYDCVSAEDPSTFNSFRDNAVNVEENFIEETVAYQALLDQYKETVESWNDIDNLDDFFAAYKAAMEQKEAVLQSAANYASYKEACEYAITYLAENNVDGEWSALLESYLEETVEPCSEFPNGSYLYIMENRNLDDAEIAKEIEFVNQMLENAIAGGITSGTEITRLLVNSNFDQGEDNFEGWTTEASDGATFSTGGVEGLTRIARGKDGKFSISQTLTETPNGVYMMSVNGMFRTDNDVNTQFYAGQLFLNSTANYVMSPCEDALPEEEAEDKVNCYLSNDATCETEFGSGYVPASITGCSYAFSADRYLNFVATEVTDGNLTVGLRSLGTGLSGDWLPFGNLHLIYLGTPEEANDQLADVLEAFADRAGTIHDFVWSDYPEDYAKYPNMSEALKDQLAELIEAVPTAATGKDKLELINKFSALFAEVHACRKAYVDMFTAANNLYDYLDGIFTAGLITSDEYDAWEIEVLDAIDSYKSGNLSTEEAQAITDKFTAVNLVPIPVTEDGTYQLATAEHLRIFSVLVSCGDAEAKAVLTEDIDLSEIGEEEELLPIGVEGNPFSGVFDGQNHKIKNLKMENISGDKLGFFGYIKNADVKNFSIDGYISYYGGTGVGAIGWSEGSTMTNVHSSLVIDVPVLSHHIGGVCGDLRAGSKAYNCSFSGTITDTGNSNDCIAGIGGYSNENCRYENCANYGTISFTASNAYAGGICGYVNNDSFVGIFNCLNVGPVQIASGSPTYGGAFVGRLRSHANSKFENNYMLKNSAACYTGENGITTGVFTVNETQMASGEVCYKLNGEQAEINWFQTLGEDAYPVLDDTHKVVYLADDGSYVNEKANTPDGTKDNPFVVKTVDDLCNLVNVLVAGRMNYVVMEDDVDMSGVTKWQPLFNYANATDEYKYPIIDFDGKNHVISNLTSNTDGAYDYCGLFGVLCGNVRNLGVENANVTCAGGTGILAGYLGHSTYGQPCFVENVWVTGKLTASGYCGGMFGNVADEAHIYNCYANVEVNGSSDLTGGIIGRVRNLVEMVQVYAAGSINRGGGIIGGGFQDATPIGTYKHVAVWNNTDKNFGPVRNNEDLRMIIYYDGTNFADMQGEVVAWDPEVWSCDMQPGSYPVLKAFTGGKGDLNGDGKVDIADAVTILNMMAAGEYSADADVNNDQKVDIADFVTILNIMAGQ